MFKDFGFSIYPKCVMESLYGREKSTTNVTAWNGPPLICNFLNKEMISFNPLPVRMRSKLYILPGEVIQSLIS